MTRLQKITLPNNFLYQKKFCDRKTSSVNNPPRQLQETLINVKIGCAEVNVGMTLKRTDIQENYRDIHIYFIIDDEMVT